MKKVLIITQYFPPLNLIASRRQEAFATNFAKFGIETDVLTVLREVETVNGIKKWKRHPAGTPVKKEVSPNYTSYLIPRIKTRKQKLIDRLMKIPLLKIPFRMFLISKGHPHGYHYYSYELYRKFLWEHLKTNKYDCIIASYKPDYPIKLAYEIKRKFGIPFVADYRDLWDNNLANIQKNFTFKQRLIHYFSKRLHQRLLKEALFFVIVNNSLRELITRLTGVDNGYAIPNGFEQAVFDADNTAVSSDFFYITYTGNIYPENDYSFFFSAIKQFLASLSDTEAKRVKIRFFAGPEANLSSQKENIPSDNLEINSWIAKNEVVQRLHESAVLLTLGFTNQRGTIPGKVFEYLGSSRNILAIPSDDNAMHELITTTNAGLSTSDPAKAASFLAEKFSEWKANAAPDYKGIPTEIIKYSREMQAKEMIELIKQKLEK